MKYAMEELLPIVKWLSEKFTGKESTSVTYETAEQLMGAVIYCINEYKKEGAGQGAGGTTLLNQEEGISAKEAYDKGYQAVVGKVLRAKALYEEIILDFKWYGNRALYDTVSKGMPAFFIHYDAKFQPQDQILTLDYPILRPLGELCGVDVIYEYLDCIRLEQVFLSGFSQEMIVKSLLQYHTDYKSLFINLPSVVTKTAIEKMIDFKNYADTHTREEAEEKMHHALELLIKERYGDDQELLGYLRNDIFCNMISGISF